MLLDLCIYVKISMENRRNRRKTYIKKKITKVYNYNFIHYLIEILVLEIIVFMQVNINKLSENYINYIKIINLYSIYHLCIKSLMLLFITIISNIIQYFIIIIVVIKVKNIKTVCIIVISIVFSLFSLISMMVFLNIFINQVFLCFHLF
jgi:hypothetical protein